MPMPATLVAVRGGGIGEGVQSVYEPSFLLLSWIYSDYIFSVTMPNLLNDQVSPQVLAAIIGATVASLFAIAIGFINKRHDLEKERRKYKREKSLEFLVLINKTNKLYIERLTGITIECLKGTLQQDNATIESLLSSCNQFEFKQNTSETSAYITLFFPKLTNLYNSLEEVWLEALQEYNRAVMKKVESITLVSEGKSRGDANAFLIKEMKCTSDSTVKIKDKSKQLIKQFNEALSLEFKKI